MSLQFLYFRINSFFHCIFETLAMRTKPKYQNLNEEDEECLYLSESYTIQR